MRSLIIRPGETFVIGDTAISAENQAAQVEPPVPLDSAPCSHPIRVVGQIVPKPTPLSRAAPANPIQHQSHQQWLAAYEREERRLAGGRVR